MAYLKAIKERIKQDDYPGFLKIWEEYCYSESIDAIELKSILEVLKESNTY